MKIDISPEIIFATARSGGKGGQNVNKVETMVEGRWNIQDSALISEDVKKLLLLKLAHKTTNQGYLLAKSQEARTQLANKELVIKKMNLWVNAALQKKKSRIATATPKAVIEKRLESKKIKSVYKQSRKKLKPGDY